MPHFFEGKLDAKGLTFGISIVDIGFSVDARFKSPCHMQCLASCASLTPRFIRTLPLGPFTAAGRGRVLIRQGEGRTVWGCCRVTLRRQSRRLVKV